MAALSRYNENSAGDAESKLGMQGSKLADVKGFARSATAQQHESSQLGTRVREECVLSPQQGSSRRVFVMLVDMLGFVFYGHESLRLGQVQLPKACMW